MMLSQILIIRSVCFVFLEEYDTPIDQSLDNPLMATESDVDSSTFSPTIIVHEKLEFVVSFLTIGGSKGAWQVGSWSPMISEGSRWVLSTLLVLCGIMYHDIIIIVVSSCDLVFFLPPKSSSARTPLRLAVLIPAHEALTRVETAVLPILQGLAHHQLSLE